MSRLSTVAVSTLVPALKVLSTTLPDSTFFSLVRTNAPPLPGLTCWNSTTVQSWPSRLSTMPFFRSLVVATSGCPSACGGLRRGQECGQAAGRSRHGIAAHATGWGRTGRSRRDRHVVAHEGPAQRPGSAGTRHQTARAATTCSASR